MVDEDLHGRTPDEIRGWLAEQPARRPISHRHLQPIVHAHDAGLELIDHLHQVLVALAPAETRCREFVSGGSDGRLEAALGGHLELLAQPVDDPSASQGDADGDGQQDGHDR